MPFNIFLLTFLAIFRVDSSDATDTTETSAFAGHELTQELVVVSKLLATISVSNCTVVDAKIPLEKTTSSLPPPSPSLHLKFVALGRGTQNYTCSSSDVTMTPVAVGAVATLFDASCILKSNPELLHQLPASFQTVPLNAMNFLAAVTGRILFSTTDTIVLGEHYFNARGSPVFDLRLGGYPHWIGTKKVSSAVAPTKGNDAPWLKLEATDSSTTNGIQVGFHIMSFS
ncbi:uncharacterized protein ATNIH1004_008295 [Aspergillus tanneri]|uniref:Uncharacterized protein n=1 Tax=Aspergillus tanneri TaxID=1220188 RepID=A0A5M9MMZ8_9EURO|nr:uncharacterized protein ATNIH1004_008295 [Aspergillus tanneri]KAA8644097.1 hypothetical protein ATNIH1004_008295 [Aspergillus tanneri]